MTYGLFLGCNMPTYRPDVERSIRLSMNALDIKLVDLEGYACCPAFGTFPSVNEDAKLSVNAWNFAISEEMGVDLLVQCGSCYSSLRTGKHTLSAGQARRERINDLLRTADKVYHGMTEVQHVTDVLYHEVGVEQIMKRIHKDLTGLRAVIQYPCHTLFPSDIVGFEDVPSRPHILGDLVSALGATVEGYSCEYMCCGGAGGFAKSSHNEALAFTKRKLDSILTETRADFIVVSCITCLLHLDGVQKQLNNGEQHYSIPVFDYNQLLAMCLGFPVKETASIAITPREAITDRFASL